MTPRPADTLLLGGNIHTLSSQQPFAEALAIREGRIVAVGTDLDVQSLAGPSTHAVHLRGRTVIPGFTDSHIHLEQYAQHLQQVDCETATLDACLERVGERAATLPSGTWILGHGWNHHVWGDYGNAERLDAVSPHHPVFLTAKSLHAAWVNTRALSQAGIESGTPPPPGGAILTDGDGNPTGILLETAVHLVSAIIPPWDTPQRVEAFLAAQESLLELGVTAVHDFDGESCHSALKAMQASGTLALRVVKNVPAEDLDMAIGAGHQTGQGDEWLRIGNVKVFSDGALGPRTAWMLEPYHGEPDNVGLPQIEADELVDLGHKAARAGLALAVHAIGDRANREALNAIERLRRIEADEGLPHFRHRMEHLQLLHPQDIPRPASLGIIASMQPIHATSDYPMADRFWGARVQTAYAWRSLLDCGSTLVFGADAPVESPNPYWGLHAAVARRRRDGSPGGAGWVPSQRIDLRQALRAYTTAPAYAAGVEAWAGQLQPGFVADLVVLNADPFRLQPAEVADLLPAATMVDGKWRLRQF